MGSISIISAHTPREPQPHYPSGKWLGWVINLGRQRGIHPLLLEHFDSTCMGTHSIIPSLGCSWFPLPVPGLWCELMVFLCFPPLPGRARGAAVPRDVEDTGGVPRGAAAEGAW